MRHLRIVLLACALFAPGASVIAQFDFRILGGPQFTFSRLVPPDALDRSTHYNEESRANTSAGVGLGFHMGASCEVGQERGRVLGAIVLSRTVFTSSYSSRYFSRGPGGWHEELLHGSYDDRFLFLEIQLLATFRASEQIRLSMGLAWWNMLDANHHEQSTKDTSWSSLSGSGSHSETEVLDSNGAEPYARQGASIVLGATLNARPRISIGLSGQAGLSALQIKDDDFDWRWKSLRISIGYRLIAPKEQ